jgi:glycosyltransferase involved in cell wall biosynthesis
MDRRRLGVVIPALNEAQSIFKVVTSVSELGLVIVVDDGSRDGTALRAAEAGAHVVQHATNLGYDEALNSGFRRASELECHYVITMDADGQHDSVRVSAFIRALEEGADLVLGVRDRCQRIGELLFAFVAKRVWGISDPLCGMKAYRMSLYHRLGHFDSYRSIGTELAIYAARQGLCVVQLPVKTLERADEPRFGKRFTANKQILRALWIALCLRY